MYLPTFDYRLDRPPVSLADIRTMPGYSRIVDIPRITADAAGRIFSEQYRQRQLPVVIEGGVRHWKLFSAWAEPDYFRSRIGNEVIGVLNVLALDILLKKISEYSIREKIVRSLKGGRTSKDVMRRSMTDPMRHRRQMSVTSYLDQIMASDANAKTTISYAQQIRPPTEQLLDDLRTLTLPFCGVVAADLRPLLFFGRRTYSDSHEHHGLDSLTCQVAGEKEFILHPPGQQNDEALYSGFITMNWSPVRFFDVDLKRFPDFKNNTPFRAHLSAGDVVYIPDGWWHAVASVGDGFSSSVALWLRSVWQRPPVVFDGFPQRRRAFLDGTTRLAMKQNGFQPPPYWPVAAKHLGYSMKRWSRRRWFVDRTHSDPVPA